MGIIKVILSIDMLESLLKVSYKELIILALLIVSDVVIQMQLNKNEKQEFKNL